MNADGWAAGADPWPMVEYLTAGEGRASDRKLRLYCAACCWGVSAELGADAERIIEWGNSRAKDAFGWARCWAGDQKQPTRAQRAALLREIVGDPFTPVTLPPSCRTRDVLALAHAAYDERGRPCGRCVANPKQNWRDRSTCTACGMTGVMEDGTLDPVRLAVLADCLEEAGCCDARLLDHLRGFETVSAASGGVVQAAVWVPLRGPHVRGCWALDLILNRE